MVRVFACIALEHNLWLLLLAALICALTSVSAFLMLSRAAEREGLLAKVWALAAGGTAGLGVWATHFVAMTAYDVGLPLGFAPLPLFGSLAISLGAQIGMFWLAFRLESPRFKVLAGVGAGLGVTAMHYSGMTGLIAPAIQVWDADLVAASVLFAGVFGATAMAHYFFSERRLRAIWAGVVFVLAICGLHFTAMGALTLVPIGGEGAAPGGLSQAMLGVVVGFGAFLFVLTSLVTALADAYLVDRRRLENIRLRESVEKRTAELVMLAQEQSILKDRAEAANTAKSQFLANMSHELRTPLNAIIGYGEIILEDIEAEPLPGVKADANRIVGAARHLLTIINDVLDLSKIDAGRMALDVIECEVAALAQQALETIGPAAAANGDTLRADIAADLGVANADPVKLKQCLMNLLSNAVKFTDNGEVLLRARRMREAGREWLVFDIADTGIGMSREQIARLFQPFAQADATVTRTYGGTGLGLSITQRLARLMGGDVSVESTPGAGSTFTLRVLADLAADQVDDDAPVIEARDAPDDRPLVLVLEDDVDARDIVRRTLEPLGFAVWASSSGAAGARKIAERAPALIMLDLNLQEKSGWEILAEMRRAPAEARAPIVVISSESERQRTIALGACEHLVKPLDRQELAAAALRFARRRPDDGEQGPVEQGGAEFWSAAG